MTDEPTRTMGQNRDLIVRQSTGSGFANEAGAFELLPNADPNACRAVLERVCRHLSVGEIEAAMADLGIEVEAVFRRTSQ